MSVLFIDIETAPLPPEESVQFMPEFEAPSNYKDPEKITANIHQQKERWLADGALSALTGKVICIGTLHGEEFWCDSGPEELLLARFWDVYQHTPSAFCGHCIKSFDLPFLRRRAWRHKLNTPPGVCTLQGKYDGRVLDTAEIWAHGSRDPRDRISLDYLAKFLGVGQKMGEGKDFHTLWQQDRDAAMAYLKNDLWLVKESFRTMTA